MAAPRNTLTRDQLPAKGAHRFGLQTASTFDQQPNGHWMFGAGWQEQCGTNLQIAPDNCDPLLTSEDRTKESFALNDGVGTQDFTLYAFHRCSAVGTAISERSAYAQEELNLGEWYQVEKMLGSRIIAEGTAIVTQTSASAALGALLESWALPIEPTVHVSPNVAIALGSQVLNKTNHLEIRTGERLVNGFGYAESVKPDDAPFLANIGSGFIALTGPVFGTYGTALQNEQMDPATNTYLALAERPYSVGYLCKAIYAKVTGLAATT